MARPRIYATAVDRVRAWRERNPDRNAEQTRRSVKAWRSRNPDARRHELAGYGLSREEWLLMLASQDGRCAICQRATTATLHVDHDHTTGRIRGLLCRNCNVALGLFRDDAEALTRAAAYLGARS